MKSKCTPGSLKSSADDLWHSKHADVFCVIVIIIGNRGEKLQKAGLSKIKKNNM